MDRFNDDQLNELRFGREHGLDVSRYTDPEYSADRMEILKRCRHIRLHIGLLYSLPLQKLIPAFLGLCRHRKALLNLAGRDEILNYLFREIFNGTFEEELNEILRALKIASAYYRFSEEEIKAAPLIYRCVKPLWFTRVYELKEAKDDVKAIKECLDKMEYAQTRDIDFESVMRQNEEKD